MAHRDEEGASAVEYGLLVVAVAAVIAIVVFTMGGLIAGLFSDSCGTVGGQIAGATCGP